MCTHAQKVYMKKKESDEESTSEKVFLLGSLISEKVFIWDGYNWRNRIHEYFLHMNDVFAISTLNAVRYYKYTAF